MAVVRRQRVHPATVGIQRDGEVPAVLHPEVAVEPAFEVGGLALEGLGEPGIAPDEARQADAAQLGVVGVALELAGGPRKAWQGAVAVGDRVPGVLPALVLKPGLPVATLVGDVPVSLQVRVLVDPAQRRAGLELQFLHQPVTGPPLVLIEQHNEQRRRVGAAVVGRVGSLLEGGQLAIPHLVEDPARILVAEVVDAGGCLVEARVPVGSSPQAPG